jgi:hypothetical protein
MHKKVDSLRRINAGIGGFDRVLDEVIDRREICFRHGAKINICGHICASLSVPDVREM